MPTTLRILFLVFTSALISSCGSFDRAWEEALAESQGTTPRDGFAGAWRGRWNSETTGHEGALRCLVSPALARPEGSISPVLHESWYWAKWSLFSGAFRTQDSVRSTGLGSSSVEGSRNLGPFLGGTFSHEGIIEGDHFQSRYSSRLDEGTFELRRVR